MALPRPVARRIGAALVTLLTCSILLAAVFAPVTSAAPGEDDTPIENPDLVASCGIDILVILDASTSIESAGATDDVQRAFTAFTEALNNTGSHLAVAEFATVARLPLAGTAAQTYTTVTDASIATTFGPYIDSFDPDGYTNWEDGFRVGRYFLPPRSPAIPHLTVFITDGDPNRVVRSNVTYDPGNPNVAENQYELQVPLASSQVQSASENASADAAVSNANALKAQGSHILALAVGNGLSSSASLDRLVSVSGPNVFDGSGTFDISTHDVYREPDFDQLETALREAAFQLCAPSINVRKLVDHDPDPAVDDLQPAQGWEMTAESDPAPETWVLPADATGSTATSTTGPDGFVTFQWNTSAPVDSSVTVTETVQPGFVYDPTATTCTYRTPDSPTDQPLPDFELVENGFTGTVTDDAIVTCEMVNRIPPAPAISIVKSTNGADANDPPGPLVPVGETVTWTYAVTNTGNVPLSDIAVTDDQGVTVTCLDTELDPGVSMTCTATGIAVAGQYANIGSVTATGPGPTGPVTVTDDDPSHYLGVQPGIDIEKATNGDDADLAPGPYIPVGGEVDWTYVVTNTGTTALTDVTVTDDQGVTVTCPDDELAIGGQMTCTAAGTAVAGQYENIGSVVGTSPIGPVQDSDVSHYFGEIPSIQVEKLVNGEDADTAPGVLVPVGSPVRWTFAITNTGNVPLTWALSDSQLAGPFACPRLILLLPGQTIACFGPQQPAEIGPHQNIATVEGTSPSGAVVDDDDPANYFGTLGAIDLEKFTNGVDADQPPGPFVPVGSTVTWTYVVTNTGNVPLLDIGVDDLRGVLTGISVTCPQSTLAVGASMTCTATGIALPDQYTNLAVVTAVTEFDQVVRDVDPSHYFGSVPGVDLQKHTNGLDADEAPGPLIHVGDPVEWTYIVTNSGNAPLSDLVVTDDQGVAVTCPATTLAVGASMTCTAAGTAVEGQYENLGTVTGTGAGGATVSDDDPSHYYGVVSAIDIEKSTNGEDADTAPGPSIPVGGAVEWTYVVTNPGNVAIRSVTVSDDQEVVPTFVGGDTDDDDELDPGETWTYTASGTATAGQYTNVGSVEGLDLLEDPVTDDDPSHYFGADPAIAIEKSPDEATVPYGGSHTFTITVTNTGNVDLTDVVVSDPIVPACDREIGDLAVGDVVEYTCTIDSVTEVTDNVATVIGVPPDGGDPVTDEDDARVIPEIALVGDFVWLDLDADGEQDDGEPGIEGAAVEITELAPEVGTAAVGDQTTWTTDAGGHYLATLAPGRYQVALDLDSVDGTLTTVASYTVTLADGDEYLDADFGLTDGGALPDTAAGAIAELGRVLSGAATVPALAGLLAAIAAGVVGGLLVLHRRRQVVPPDGPVEGESQG